MREAVACGRGEAFAVGEAVEEDAERHGGVSVLQTMECFGRVQSQIDGSVRVSHFRLRIRKIRDGN